MLGNKRESCMQSADKREEEEEEEIEIEIHVRITFSNGDDVRE